MATKWKNPYAVKRNDHAGKISPARRSAAISPAPEDFGAWVQKFRESIHEVSGTFQSMEKAVDSLAQLYRAFEKMGGQEKLNQLLAAFLPSAGHSRRQAKDGANPISLLNQLMNLLQQIDFNQINQILTSPLFQEWIAGGGEKEKDETKQKT